MIEAPNFEYKYDLALWKSFSARLSVAILIIAAGVFLVALLTYLYFSEELVKEETAIKARTELHDAVLMMRLRATEAEARGDTMGVADYVALLQEVRPYRHSFTLMADSAGQMVYAGDTIIWQSDEKELRSIGRTMSSGESGMREVFQGARLSLLIYEPVGKRGLAAAVVCSRTDILSSYKVFIFYGGIAFLAALLVLFGCSAIAIYRMVKPLHLFADSAMSIAEGNLDTPLPDIQSEDELLQLRNSFAYMQTSLKQYIEDLKVTTATKEHMESELTIAHDIQMGMITKDFPHRDDVDIYASMLPAREVGGDLYDVVIDGDELFFIVGDVAGKGVPASLYMAVTRTLFRNLASNYQSPANVVREINRAILSGNDQDLFVTLFAGVLDLKTHVLTYCNAAQNAPVLVSPTGECSLLEVEPNLPIGLVDRYTYEEQQMAFEPGSALLLYTDGLTEAVSPQRELFGEDRLLACMRGCHLASARQVIAHLQQEVTEFVGDREQSDDLTMLFIRHLECQPEEAGRRTIVMKNEVTEVERLRTFVSSVCRELKIDNSMMKTINLALEEAVVNVINYAYPKGTRGHVEVTARGEGNRLLLTIIDSGKPFDPTQADVADTTTDLDKRAVGGLGIYLVRNLMDDVRYERTADGQNVLTLVKKIS